MKKLPFLGKIPIADLASRATRFLAQHVAEEIEGKGRYGPAAHTEGKLLPPCPDPHSESLVSAHSRYGYSALCKLLPLEFQEQEGNDMADDIRRIER